MCLVLTFKYLGYFHYQFKHLNLNAPKVSSRFVNEKQTPLNTFKINSEQLFSSLKSQGEIDVYSVTRE